MLETTDAALNRANLDAFREGLRALGYVEGQNLAIEYRSADGRAERFAAHAAELVASKVDVIVTRGTPAALAAWDASPTIPVVMAASGEPFGTGVVAGLASPGGHVTGLSSFNNELEPKRLELLSEFVPGVAIRPCCCSSTSFSFVLLSSTLLITARRCPPDVLIAST